MYDVNKIYIIIKHLCFKTFIFVTKKGGIKFRVFQASLLFVSSAYNEKFVALILDIYVLKLIFLAKKQNKLDHFKTSLTFMSRIGDDENFSF